MPSYYEIDSITISKEVGCINILTEDYTLIVNNIFCSS